MEYYIEAKKKKNWPNLLIATWESPHNTSLHARNVRNWMRYIRNKNEI